VYVCDRRVRSESGGIQMDEAIRMRDANATILCVFRVSTIYLIYSDILAAMLPYASTACST
jgi:hypothetical protein